MNPDNEIDASALFGKFVPLGLTCYPDKAREIGAIFQFKINGEGGGEWVLDCSSTPPNCQRDRKLTEEQVANACIIEIEHSDLKKILADPNEGLNLYFNQRITLTGKIELALKLSAFHDFTRPYPV